MYLNMCLRRAKLIPSGRFPHAGPHHSQKHLPRSRPAASKICFEANVKTRGAREPKSKPASLPMARAPVFLHRVSLCLAGYHAASRVAQDRLPTRMNGPRVKAHCLRRKIASRLVCPKAGTFLPSFLPCRQVCLYLTSKRLYEGKMQVCAGYLVLWRARSFLPCRQVFI